MSPHSPRARACMARLAVAAVFAGAIVVLLGPALVGRTVVLPHDLLLERLPWQSVEQARNPELRDVLDVYYPVQHALTTALRRQTGAVWLHDVSLGLPGALFLGWGGLSPFTLLAVVLPFELAWSWAMALRLFVAMTGAYTLTRTLGAGRVGGVVAGLSFGLSGYMVGWLGWPQSHVGAFAPWVLWATWRASAPHAPRWAIAACAVATLGLWVGGFPAVAVYTLLAAFALAVVSARYRDGLRARVRGVAAATGGLALGTGLAAFTLLPTVAVLDVLDLSGRQAGWQAHLPLDALPLFVAPHLFGNVLESRWLLSVARTEALGYAGVVPLLLAFAAWIIRPRRPGLGSFTLVALFFGALSFGVPPLPRLVSLIPPLAMNPPTRTLSLVGLAIAVTGGLGADALLRLAFRDARMTWHHVAGLVSSIAVVAASAFLLWPLLAARVRALAPRELRDEALAAAASNGLVAVALLVLVTVGAMTGVAAARLRGVSPRWLGAFLVAVVAFDLLTFAHGWNVQTPRAELFPDAPGLAALRDASKSYRVAGADGVGHPNTHLEYQFRDIRAHAFVTPRQREVLQRLGAQRLSPTLWDLDANDSLTWEPWLSVLGVRAVLAPAQTESLPGVVASQPGGEVLLGALVAGEEHHTRVTAPVRGTLRGVVLRLATFQRNNVGDVLVHVERSDGASRVGRIWAGDVRDNTWTTVPIARMGVRQGEALTITVTGAAADADEAVGVWGHAGAPARPSVGLAFGKRWSRRLEGPVAVFTNPSARPVVHAVADAERVAPGAALDAVARDGPGGALERAYVEVQPEVALPDGSGRARVLTWKRADGRARATVESDRGAVLVLADQALPGWGARIDGRKAQVVVADHLFVAVIVPPGVHDVSVQYQPPGAQAGLVVSAGAAVLLLLGLVSPAIISFAHRLRRRETFAEQRLPAVACAAHPAPAPVQAGDKVNRRGAEEGRAIIAP